MKIGFLVPNFYPDMTGGIEWYSYNITRELAKRDNKVYVFTQLTQKAKKSNEIIHGIRVCRIKSFGFFYRVRLWPGLIKLLQKYNLDIIITFDYAQTQTWQVIKFGRKNNIPILILLYDIQSLKKPRQFIKQLALDFFDKFCAKLILKKANLILTRTKAPNVWLKNLGVDLKKIKITPAGITDQELLPGRKENFEKKFKIKGNIILYLGRIRAQKGIFLLLDAFSEIKKSVPSAKLVYIGTDEKEYDGLEFTSKLKQKIVHKSLSDVYILGPIYGMLKNDALAACDFLALPSSYEAFGQVFLQAMAQGKPVIGTHAGGVPYVVDHEKNGFLIKPWNKKELIHYAIKLLKNANLRAALGQAGKEKVLKYRYAKLAQEMEGICKEVIRLKH